MRKKYEKKAKKPEYCRGCIHEKDDPCVGFCMKSILKKDQKEEAGEDHAG